MIKVGDRVKCYAIEEISIGKVFHIDEDKKLLRVMYDGESISDIHTRWFNIKQCRKLIKRKKYSKVNDGDRVIVKHPFVGSGNNKGRITCHCDALDHFSIRFDDGMIGLYSRKSFKKLIKHNKPKFKIGDRVITKAGKGIVLTGFDSIRDKKSYCIVYLDSNWSCEFREDELKKLIKKKVEFKVGDRVLIENSKGTILTFNASPHNTLIALVKVDNESFALGIPLDHLKKLIKKKPQFKVGDRILTDISDISWVKEKKSKGKVIEILPNARLMIAFDSYFCPMSVSVDFCKRLIKKKIEFKLGDRVSGCYSNAGINNFKGIITYIFDEICNVELDGELVDGQKTTIRTYLKYLKKLVKKKKSPTYTTSDIIKNAWKLLEWNKEPKSTNQSTDKVEILWGWSSTLERLKKTLDELKDK